MFEKLLEEIFQKHLHAYVTDVDLVSIKSGIWKGDIQIENAKLKQGLIDLIGLPINLISSHIGVVRVLIPWK